MTTAIQKPPVKTPQQPVRENKLGRFVRAFVRNLVWGIGTLIVSLLLLEAGFRLCGVGGEEHLRIEPVIGFTHMPNKPIIMRSEGWSNEPINSQSDRDFEVSVTPAPGVRRIAFLGDSKTESLQVPMKYNFVSEIQRRLNAENPNQKFECLNFGMSNYGTAQELLQFMTHVKQYKPEMTVLVYHVLDNDENAAPLTQELTRPRPYFSISDEGQLRPNWAYLDAWLGTERATYFKMFDWLRKNSYTLGVISQLDKSLAGNKTYDFYSKKILAPALESFSNMPAFRYAADPEAKAQRELLAREFEKPVPNAFSTDEEVMPDRYKPDFLKKEYNVWLLNHRLNFRVTASLIRKLNAVCKENGSKLVVAGLPAPTSQMWYFRELKALKQIGKEEGFEFVNLHTGFPQTEAGESSPLFVGFHFSREGHQLVADLLTPSVSKQLNPR